MTRLLDTPGYWDASLLIEGWSGQVIDVPVVVGPDHPLSVTLGCFAAGRLAAVYGGGQVEVPTSLSSLDNGRALDRVVGDLARARTSS